MNLRIEIEVSTPTRDLRPDLFHDERRALVEGAFRRFAYLLGKALGSEVHLDGFRINEAFCLPATVHVGELPEG